MKLKTLVLSGLLVASPFCGAAFAQATGIYIGADIGAADFGQEIGPVSAQGGTVTSIDDSDVGYNVVLGWRMNERWALEGGYSDPGRQVVRGTGITPVFGGTFSARAHPTAWSLGARYNHVLNERWGLDFRGGVHMWKTEWSTRGSILPIASSDGSDIYAGVKLSWNLNARFNLNAGIDHYWASPDWSLYHVGAVLKF